ncbi:ANTAR domain-containing response regulator [Bacillus sp. 03113]|uniref:ANTAR domain-containing response regulator n=1 Tax=Bacillus sp. 03113 TaxID=2578211 RepID=UPI0011445D98|nr:response regulator [Bacillus sp. 03113]
MKYKIIIVDDEPITRLDMKEMLEGNGYHVVGEGKNGEEAIEKAHLLKPDLMIMDVKMPRVDGIKAASIIKGFSDCAIILLTAYSHQDLVEEAKKANVNAYLVKPIKERELLPAVEITLNQREQFLLLQNKIGHLEQKMAERKTIEKAKGLLMKRRNCSEEQAYHLMQKASMKRQMPLAKIAEKIIQQTSS